MGNVYVVWNDNGEDWEDNFYSIEKIFSTRKSAERYLDDKFEKVNSNKWHPRKYECKITGNVECTKKCALYKAWCDEDYKTDVPCTEYDSMMAESYDYQNQYWYIQEYELFD